MIPVRVSAAVRPPRATGDTPRLIAADHPLASWECPVCDELLGGREVHLIVVGAEPDDDRAGRSWFTGAAVAVHAECALPAPAEDPS